jgi:hypothetical protein
MDTAVASLGDGSLGSFKFLRNFVEHVVVGTLLFMTVAVAAGLLHYFISFMQLVHAPSWMTVTVTIISYAIFAIDAVLFVLHLLKQTIILAKLILKSDH